MQVLQELGLAYTMISGGLAHILVAYHLVMRSKALRAFETMVNKNGIGK